MNRRQIKNAVPLLVVTASVMAGGCAGDGTKPGTTERDRNIIDIRWTPVGPRSLDSDGVEVFEGNNVSPPLRAWYVRAAVQRPDISVDVLAANDDNGRMTVADLAASSGACIAVNGGYFRTDNPPSSHVGLLVSNGRIISHSTTGVYRDQARYTVTRASIGFTSTDSVMIGWTASRNDSVFVWDEPLPNAAGQPVTSLDILSGRTWEVENAVSGGPSIVTDHAVDIRVDEEVFFDTAVTDVHPRTAAGVTTDGDLLLLVVDGRQNESRGVSLEELAAIMRQIGAKYALNLDGGRSSTLVVDGELMNRPMGSAFQREVVSALAISCHGR